MTAAVVLGIAVGGAFGAAVRYLLDRYLPAGLLAANALGCFGAGILYGLLVSGSGLDEQLATVLAVGVFSALTTFATVSLRSALLCGWTGGAGRLPACGLLTLEPGWERRCSGS
ncbi:CrcB family protein [Nesterenkonia sp. NBAIMH1]|uniref:fluoride efflux transporter FluC n=1 Tax=Nesterenkonia sp. NBAIMH1 TaxID=2600320 RepID=UPI0011B7877E|nr:CrcB family protein [Nesterenkonia sp. NBAIMH1]